MLEPQGRLLLLDALRPPAGFVLDRAIGTTYTLDLAALLTAPVGFALLDREARDGRPVTDPVALLDAVRRYADRIHVFCQAGAIAIPPAYKSLLSYLEDSIHEVIPPAPEAIFHPKVWVIRYRAAVGDDVRYRLLNLSRNLTFDRSWDTILQLDGAPGSLGWDANKPLAAFLRALPQMGREAVSPAIVADIEAMAEELMKIRFELPPPFAAYLFSPLGLDGSTVLPFPRNADRVLAVSPFLTGGFLARMARGRAGRDVLVSRPESFDAVGGDALQRFTDTYVLSGDASGVDEGRAPDGSATQPVTTGPGVELRGLHAKLFLFETGDDVRVFTGSANATDAAFGGNVEFLVELRGKKALIGIDKTLGDASREGPVSLRSLLESYRPLSDGPLAPTAVEALERELDTARRYLAAFTFEALVTPEAGTDRYALTLAGVLDRSIPEPDWAGIRVLCRPLTIEAAYAVEVTPHDGRIEVPFGFRSFQAITSFFTIELEGRVDGVDVRLATLVNARLIGAPRDRRERLLVELLRNRGDLLRFLLLLLGGDPESAGELELGPDTVAKILLGEETADSHAPEFLNLFEPMVRALAKDPARLDEIDRLVSDLQRTRDGRELLPSDWAAIWEPIRQVRPTRDVAP